MPVTVIRCQQRFIFETVCKYIYWLVKASIIKKGPIFRALFSNHQGMSFMP